MYITTGLATKILEYVPIITPIIIANENVFSTSPPKRNNIRTTKKVVREVTIVRLKESFILWLITVINVEFLSIFEFSRILSKITIVSFKEYPTIVRKAAITAKDISNPKKVDN